MRSRSNSSASACGEPGSIRHAEAMALDGRCPIHNFGRFERPYLGSGRCAEVDRIAVPPLSKRPDRLFWSRRPDSNSNCLTLSLNWDLHRLGLIATRRSKFKVECPHSLHNGSPFQTDCRHSTIRFACSRPDTQGCGASVGMLATISRTTEPASDHFRPLGRSEPKQPLVALISPKQSLRTKIRFCSWTAIV